MLAGWFVTNRWHASTCELTYAEFLTKYTWDLAMKTWKERCWRGGTTVSVMALHVC